MGTVEIGPDALATLPDAVRTNFASGPIAMLTDAQPMRRAGDDLKELVAARLAALDRSFAFSWASEQRSCMPRPGR
jgi:hypothetical protein